MLKIEDKIKNMLYQCKKDIWACGAILICILLNFIKVINYYYFMMMIFQIALKGQKHHYMHDRDHTMIKLCLMDV